MREKFQRTSEGMTPTVLAVKFGMTDKLAKLTGEAKQLAAVADSARDAWKAIHGQHWQNMGDPTVTEAGRLVRSARAAKGHLARVDAAANAALDAAEARLTALRGAIDSALRAPSDAGQIAIDAEVRSLIRSEKDTARQLELVKEFPRAVATAPRVLSGLAESVWNTARNAHLEATVPERLAEYTDLLAAVDSMHNATKQLEKEAGGLIDFRHAEQLASQQYTPPEAA